MPGLHASLLIFRLPDARGRRGDLVRRFNRQETRAAR